MSEDSKRQVQLLNWQFILTLVVGLTLIVSLALIYDAKMDVIKGNKILTDKLDQDFSLYNKILVVIVTIAFLYINYQNRKLREKHQQDLRSFDLQILAGWFSLFATIIVLYVVIINYTNSTLSVVETENPSL